MTERSRVEVMETASCVKNKQSKAAYNTPKVGSLPSFSAILVISAGNESSQVELSSARLDSIKINSARNSTRVRHELFFQLELDSSSQATRFDSIARIK